VCGVMQSVILSDAAFAKLLELKAILEKEMSDCESVRRPQR
jgi:hypothetical protein